MSLSKEFKSVNEAKSSLEFIRPSELAKNEITGVILEGTYEGAIESKFDEEKMDFKFMTDEGKTVIVNHSGSLAYQINKIKVGDYVQLSYLGKKEITKGKLKGKSAHQFELAVA